MSILTIYKTVWQQGFMPIFVKGDWETEKLVEGCMKAGLKAIEYTLRRQDANHAIPKIIKQHPELTVLTGSVLDNSEIITQLKSKNPQLATMDELAEWGVDGFVSMFQFSADTIKKYHQTHFIAPCAYTPNEAYGMLQNGAHIIKIVNDIELVKKTRSAPSHGFCPIFFTGGATLEKIPEIIDAGAVCVASGFDLLLKDKPDDISSDEIAEIITQYVDVVQNARRKKYPELMKKIDTGDSDWMNFLPHYHNIKEDKVCLKTNAS